MLNGSVTELFLKIQQNNINAFLPLDILDMVSSLV
jgi:hypothetical protein